MSLKTAYGSLTIDVPAGWDDETLVVLKAPVPKPTVRMRAPTGELRRPSLVVRRVALVSDASLDSLAAAEAEMLAATIDDVELLPPRPCEVGGVKAIERELTFAGPDGRLRQLHVSFVAGRAFFVFVGTALDDVEFPRAQFMELIRSVRVAPESG